MFLVNTFHGYGLFGVVVVIEYLKIRLKELKKRST